jgi:DNA polymerase-1
MKTTLLIDGDEYLFKACAAVEREVRWDEWNHVLFANREEAWGNFQRMIQQLFELFETQEHVLCFSSSPNFRHSIDESYKGGRAKTRKPMCYADLRWLCDDTYRCMALNCLEADDVMGILATHPRAATQRHIIVSQDKDMKTIPSTIYREGGLVTISQEEADYNHLFQTLIGDITDGYKGLPGCGPVKAQTILGASASWAAVVLAYAKAGLSEEMAIKQARLARILRYSDWDSKKKEVILWEPAKSSN